MMTESDVSEVERARRVIGRTGYVTAMFGLIAGVAAHFARQSSTSRFILIATIGTLLSLPVVNVIAILVEEIRRRDWSFVIAALLVLALLGFNVVRRLFE